MGSSVKRAGPMGYGTVVNGVLGACSRLWVVLSNSVKFA